LNPTTIMIAERIAEVAYAADAVPAASARAA
jgi:hypothetical protein